jgi:hypothetical protein
MKSLIVLLLVLVALGDARDVFRHRILKRVHTRVGCYGPCVATEADCDGNPASSMDCIDLTPVCCENGSPAPVPDFSPIDEPVPEESVDTPVDAPVDSAEFNGAIEPCGPPKNPPTDGTPVPEGVCFDKRLGTCSVDTVSNRCGPAPQTTCCPSPGVLTSSGRDFPETDDMCFPIARGDSTWGNGIRTGAINEASFAQRRGKRCHRGLDMFTGSERAPSLGRVLAIADGTVRDVISSFTQCRGGWWPELDNENVMTPLNHGKCYHAYAVIVHHPSINKDVVYGENTLIFVDDTTEEARRVTKGQLIGLNTICGMLHFELWNPDSRISTKLRPRPGTSGNCVSGDNAPTGVAGLNNPRKLLRHLQGKWCDPPAVLPPITRGFSLSSRFDADAHRCGSGGPQCTPCNFNS